MTRVVLLIAYTTVGLVCMVAAIAAGALEAWHWCITLTTASIQCAIGLQLVMHGAQIERQNDVIGAWRRQDPDAWRRE